MTQCLYLIINFIAITFLLLSTKAKVKGNKIKASFIFMLISFMFLFLLVILRDISVGKDYRTYVSLYLRIINNNITTIDKEWIGIVFQYLCTTLGFFFKENYILSYGVISGITLGIYYKTFNKESKIPWMSLMIWLLSCLYYQCFNQFRQALAIGICLYSIKYIKEQNFKKYLITILIATGIHTSAIVLVPMYFIGNLKLNLKSLIIYATISLFLFLFIDKIFNLLSNTSYGSVYLGTSFDQSFSTSSIQNLLVRIALMLGSLLFYKPIIKNNPKANVYFHFAIVCTIVQLLTIQSTLFGRITTYFFIVYTLLIPEIVNLFKNKDKIMITTVVILLFLAYHTVYYNSTQGAISGGYEKYKTILNN